MKRLALVLAAATVLAGGVAHAGGDKTDAIEQARDKADGKWSYHDKRADRVHGPAWVAPKGWIYNRYAQGDFMPSLLQSEAYFVDPASLGLPPLAAGRHWVRAGAHLYLVAGHGKVLEMIPDVYY